MRTLSSHFQETLKTTGQLAAAGFLVVCGGAIAMAVVMHLLDPVHFGLWWGPHAFFFGSAEAPAHARQAPGRTLYETALVAVPLCLLVSRELVGFVLERRGRH
jgi:hypothetical protein